MFSLFSNPPTETSKNVVSLYGPVLIPPIILGEGHYVTMAIFNYTCHFNLQFSELAQRNNNTECRF